MSSSADYGRLAPTADDQLSIHMLSNIAPAFRFRLSFQPERSHPTLQTQPLGPHPTTRSSAWPQHLKEGHRRRHYRGQHSIRNANQGMAAEKLGAAVVGFSEPSCRTVVQQLLKTCSGSPDPAQHRRNRPNWATLGHRVAQLGQNFANIWPNSANIVRCSRMCRAQIGQS